MSAATADTRSIVFAGVGGQGTITAANILSQVLVAHGFDVKTSEVHGMAQRGGSVISMVRFGEVVFSPLVPHASAEAIIATELLEGLRSLEFLAPGGRMIASRTRVDPLPVLQGAVKYPADAEERLLEFAPRSIVVDAAEIARQAGNERAANTVLLGILSTSLPPNEAEWMAVIERQVKAKAIDANKAAFVAGRRLA
jgi:indolepyruvate ferredoxin oxidoreductase, beta subunit